VVYCKLWQEFAEAVLVTCFIEMKRICERSVCCERTQGSARWTVRKRRGKRLPPKVLLYRNPKITYILTTIRSTSHSADSPRFILQVTRGIQAVREAGTWG